MDSDENRKCVILNSIRSMGQSIVMGNTHFILKLGRIDCVNSGYRHFTLFYYILVNNLYWDKDLHCLRLLSNTYNYTIQIISNISLKYKWPKTKKIQKNNFVFDDSRNSYLYTKDIINIYYMSYHSQNILIRYFNISYHCKQKLFLPLWHSGKNYLYICSIYCPNLKPTRP